MEEPRFPGVVSRPSPYLCARCKGSRRLCGLPYCPILVRARELAGVYERVRGRRELEAPSPPSVLVGEKGYPYIRVGVNLVGGEEGSPSLYEDPGAWWGRLDLYEVLRLRASMVYSYGVYSASRAVGRVGESVREAALSLKPVESEAVFRRPPDFSMRFDPLLKPVGFSAEVERLSVVSNPYIPRRVDQLIEDRVKASRAAVELYERGFDVYYIQRVLSSGALGVSKKFVPTRWAITAVDRLIGDYLLGKVKGYPEVSSYELYHSSYIGNYYSLLLMPGKWSLEMVEVWLPNSVWVPGSEPYVSTVHEWSDGKPSGEDGGYEAIRLAVLEHLAKRGRVASVLAVREITPEYFAPVGNWQIRESVRAALRGGGESFPSLGEALEALKEKLRVPLNLVLSRSTLLAARTRQRSITEFLHRE
ncbi:Nre family DNA repair protein [Thermofilum pendens]|uniref:DNA repair protein n=1 Tax=Thermofilum pendens (strain DSM 2475 / Hrk 5) TaxID=368408 RepID=A1RYR3_THEPD|nr:Nre family DNA repair protein [Thermofilum pendens]ABL78343.1 Protein of unknown function DUF650, N-terminal domain [Thermofilum pendens Hrk 5]